MAITLEQAQAHLDAWLAADLALSTSEIYRMGNQTLTRANWKAVKDRVQYWANMVDKLSSGRKGARVIRVLPRDI